MSCEELQRDLDAWRSGELAASRQTEVETHIAGCDECGELVDGLDSIAGLAPVLKGEPERRCIDALEREHLDRYDHFDTSLGHVHVAFTERGIRAIRLGGTKDSFREEHAKRFGRALHCTRISDEVKREITKVIEEGGSTGLAVDLDELGEFERRVLAVLREIPQGEVRSYAWVAREAGRPGASRAVGNACARNPIPFVVPCHRVVPSSGGVGNYGYGPSMKRSLLGAEGVPVSMLDRMAAKRFRYIGSRSEGSYCVPCCSDVRDLSPDDVFFVRDERSAAAQGLRPCTSCRPLVAV